jgi:heme-degrading monooxygenase HmoA
MTQVGDIGSVNVGAHGMLEGKHMIIRQWRARAAASNAHGYPNHFRTSVLPVLLRTPGFLGAQLGVRKVDADIEFQVQTRWQSIEAIAGFAGPEIEEAVVEPGAIAELLSFDRHVEHYDVLEEEGISPRSNGGA